MQTCTLGRKEVPTSSLSDRGFHGRPSLSIVTLVVVTVRTAFHWFPAVLSPSQPVNQAVETLHSPCRSIRMCSTRCWTWALMLHWLERPQRDSEPPTRPSTGASAMQARRGEHAVVMLSPDLTPSGHRMKTRKRSCRITQRQVQQVSQDDL